MAEFKTLDEATLRKALAKAGRAPARPRAIAARLDRRRRKVWVELDTGIDFAFDPRRAHGLQDAAIDDLAGVTVEGVGSTLHFPRLDADFSVAHLLEGFLGPIAWTKREARAEASRQNGKRGGRPRKPLPLSS